MDIAYRQTPATTCRATLPVSGFRSTSKAHLTKMRRRATSSRNTWPGSQRWSGWSQAGAGVEVPKGARPQRPRQGVIVDTETTDLDYRCDEIIEIGDVTAGNGGLQPGGAGPGHSRAVSRWFFHGRQLAPDLRGTFLSLPSGPGQGRADLHFPPLRPVAETAPLCRGRENCWISSRQCCCGYPLSLRSTSDGLMCFRQA